MQAHQTLMVKMNYLRQGKLLVPPVGAGAPRPKADLPGRTDPGIAGDKRDVQPPARRGILRR